VFSLVGGTDMQELTIRQLVEYRNAVVVETGRDDLTYVDILKSLEYVHIY